MRSDAQNVSESVTDWRKAVAQRADKIVAGQCAGDCQNAPARPTVLVIELVDVIQFHGAIFDVPVGSEPVKQVSQGSTLRWPGSTVRPSTDRNSENGRPV